MIDATYQESSIGFRNYLRNFYNFGFDEFGCFAQEENAEKIRQLINIFPLKNQEGIEKCYALLYILSQGKEPDIIDAFCKEYLPDDSKAKAKYLDNPENKRLFIAALLCNIRLFTHVDNLYHLYIIKVIKQYLAMVRKDGLTIADVPAEKQIMYPAIPLAAVRQSGRALRHVKNKNFAVCLAAVKKFAFAIEYVIEIINNFNDNEIYAICEAAVTGRGATLRYLFPEKKPALPFSEQQINDLCMTAIKNDGLALAFVPAAVISKELCLAAVLQSSGAADFVPQRSPWLNEIVDAHKKQKEREEESKTEAMMRYLKIVPEEIEYYEDDEAKLCTLMGYPYKLEGIPIRLPEQVGSKGYELEIGEKFLEGNVCPSLWIASSNYRISDNAFRAMNLELIADHLPNDKAIPEELRNTEQTQGEKFIATSNLAVWMIIKTETKEDDRYSGMRKIRP
jgi:hypothetical protein